jgi:hypothetical protein
MAGGGGINSILDELALFGLLMMLNSVSVTTFLAKFIGFEQLLTRISFILFVVNLNRDRFQLRFAS